MSGVDKNISNIAFTRTVLGLLVAIIVLSVDTLNPIKLFLHVFPSLHTWHIVTLATFSILYICISEFKELLYFGAKIFINSMLSIFFRDIEVIGNDRLPRHGPMIFVINHANQFVDAMVVLGTTSNEHFKVSYLMAEKSFQRPVIGDIAAALDVVPVKRAQDEAIAGPGTLQFQTMPMSTTTGVATNSTIEDEDNTNDSDNDNDNTDDDELITSSTPPAVSVRMLKITGGNSSDSPSDNTFTTTAFRVGDKLRPNGTSVGVKVLEILDETSCVVDATPVSQHDLETVLFAGPAVKYDILKHVDLHAMFEKVLDKLATGGVFGIFPEGGSHDRTDLLPLKVGVALIAYSALERDGVSVPIVPVGLNYFGTHRWRGKCLVEYGDPVYIDPKTLPQYQSGGSSKRRVCNDLLNRIKDSMRTVIVTMPDYDSLQIVHTARRLYQRNSEIENTSSLFVEGKEKQQDLMRRFAVGYKTLMTTMAKEENKIPQAWLDLQKRIVDYRRELRELGIRDYQVPGLDRLNVYRDDYDNDGIDHHDEKMRRFRERIFRGIGVTYRIIHLLVLLLLSLLPNLLLNLPVRLMADVWAERRRKKALAGSKVKIHGYDVMLTEKLVFCIVVVPLLWFLYGLIMVFFTNFDAPTIALCFMCFPLFSYAAIISSEAGMVDGKDLKPYFLRLLPSTRKRLRALPTTRRKLRRDLRMFIKKVGPAFGELYHGKTVDWKEINESIEENRTDIMQRAMSRDNIGDIGEDDGIDLSSKKKK